MFAAVVQVTQRFHYSFWLLKFITLVVLKIISVEVWYTRSDSKSQRNLIMSYFFPNFSSKCVYQYRVYSYFIHISYLKAFRIAFTREALSEHLVGVFFSFVTENPCFCSWLMGRYCSWWGSPQYFWYFETPGLLASSYKKKK